MCSTSSNFASGGGGMWSWNGIGSDAMLPQDNYTLVWWENSEVKLEVVRMRIRLTDLVKNHVSMKRELVRVSPVNRLLRSFPRTLNSLFRTHLAVEPGVQPPGDAPYMCGDSSQMMAGDSKQVQRWPLQPSLRRSDEDDALHQGRLEEHKSSKERGNRARASKVGGLKELAATSLAACHGWMPYRPDLGGVKEGRAWSVGHWRVDPTG
uniref:Uncharacterized protein n=1 Tax=Oryza rufipogon TaxID=4529 RepID=A0A0E0QAH0_ORYRU